MLSTPYTYVHPLHVRDLLTEYLEFYRIYLNPSEISGLARLSTVALERMFTLEVRPVSTHVKLSSDRYLGN